MSSLAKQNISYEHPTITNDNLLSLHNDCLQGMGSRGLMWMMSGIEPFHIAFSMSYSLAAHGAGRCAFRWVSRPAMKVSKVTNWMCLMTEMHVL